MPLTSGATDTVDCTPVDFRPRPVKAVVRRPGQARGLVTRRARAVAGGGLAVPRDDVGTVVAPGAWGIG